MNKSCFVGIDPDQSGALAAITADGKPVALVKMPVEPHGKTKRVQGRAVRQFIEALPGHITLCMLEQVASRSKQSAQSVFTFGRANGAVEAVLGALSVPLEYVFPRQWKRLYGLATDKH